MTPSPAEDEKLAKPVKVRSFRPDVATIMGLVVGLGGITAGLLLEGGKVSDVNQITAAIIVLGGTFGAVMVTCSLSALGGALRGLKDVFFEQVVHPEVAVEEIIKYASKARKQSIMSLEPDLDGVEDPFLKKALSLAVDGTDLKELRHMMELELFQSERRAEMDAKVFEVAGGYSPTIGIIGAVIGLIQVMKHLENIDEVGRGIAVAFVATVYGVGVANLFFLPAANKLKSRIHQDILVKELLLEGVCGIVEGMNPRLIRVKLEAFLKSPGGKKQMQGAATEGSPQTAQAGG